MTDSSLKDLLSNKKEIYDGAARVLIKICGNILREPANPKFRTISLGSSTFLNSLLPAEGALNCLFDVGFVEGTDNISFPVAAPLDKLKKLHDSLAKNEFVVQSMDRGQSASNSANAVSKEFNLPTTSIPSTSKPADNIPHTAITKTYYQTSALAQLSKNISNKFLSKIIYYSESVLKYENKALQQKALLCVPVEKLNTNVENAIRSLQEAYKKKEAPTEHDDYQKLQLLALLSWFKNDFFSWMDKPSCQNCQSDNVEHSYIGPSPSKGIDRIEVYLCKNCGRNVNFTRYNDPGELLRTRVGRCGEWANCFTLICRAMGWDARLVIDETDHVWTEVYLNIPKKWVPCDPCEGVLDAPLMYESGWGKKLTYVIAYSFEEVQDVTWRYSSHHKDILLRRRAVPEDALSSVIMQIRDIKMQDLSKARQAFVIKRNLTELVDFLMEHTPNANELQGRISGSLEWRSARGETGTYASNYVWKIGPSDIQNRIIIGYSAALDSYFINDNKAKSLNGWQSGVFLAQDIQLKVEKDWKMTYLARSEGCDKSKIVWRFELSDGFVLKKVSIVFKTAVYETGKITVVLCSGDSCIQIPQGTDSLETDAFAGQKQIEITAELCGGQGSIAWQHTQLFRQSISDNEKPFVVTFETTN